MRDSLQLALNESLRGALQASVRVIGRAFDREMRRRIARHRELQEALRRRYGIEKDTAIRGFDDWTRSSVERYAARHPGARFACTSGSTAEPKRIAFTRARLRMIKRENFSVVARTMLHRRVPRPGLFILSGLKEDDSLSSLILSDQGGDVPYLSGVLMAARYLAQPAMAPWIERYGATAARLWLLVIANPGIAYSTNPSTLALFLTRVHEAWDESTALLRDFAPRRAGALEATLGGVARRIASPGWEARVREAAAARQPLPMHALAPGLRVYCCWDGGYVRPFLDSVRAHLPPERFELVPMYSMSTETIETLTHFDAGVPRFLAIAPGVLYELLPEDAKDDPAALLAPWQLEPGGVYAMVVSDAYGLVRYQTEDLFRCEALVHGVPDLRFLRRRGLTWSFTGEKLTDVQILEAFERLRRAFPALAEAGVQLTLIPHRAERMWIPGYRLVLAHPGVQPPRLGAAHSGIAARFDDILGGINAEFAGKRASARLAPTEAVSMPYDELAAQLDPKTRDAADRTGRVWDTQFKLLPLYRKLWDELGLPPC
jgi:hypothetical protein